jgi:hypothetical protein
VPTTPAFSFPLPAQNKKEKNVVTKKMDGCALTISVTWQQIANWLKGNGVKVTDETLDWALETLMNPRLIPGDMTYRRGDFFGHCVSYLAIHPEHEE